MSKIKEYAKGIAAAVGLAGTVTVEALPVDSGVRLYAGVAVAVATLVTVVTVPNAKTRDEVNAAEALLARLEQLPALARFDSLLATVGVALERIGATASAPATVVVNNAPTGDTETHVDPVVPGAAAPVVDGAGDPVGDVPADPAPVVADGDSAPEIPAPPAPPVGPPVEAEDEPVPASAPPAGVDDGVTLPDDVPAPTVGILTS